ncbi:hypothetical protein RUND412_002133 [Rhizina undulata]
MANSDLNVNFYPVFNETVFNLMGSSPRADTYQIPAVQRALLLTFFFAIIFLSLILVVARLWTRWYVVNYSFGMDDWVIIPAELATIGLITSHIYAVHKGGMGKLAEFYTYAEMLVWWKINYTWIMLGRTTIFLIRAQIIFFLQRIFPKHRSSDFTIMHILNTLIWLATTVPFALICAPREIRVWDLQRFYQAHCIAEYNLQWVKKAAAAIGVVSAALDFFLLGVPVSIVWRVKSLDFSKRLRVCFVIGIGISTCITSLIACLFFLQWALQPQSSALSALIIPLRVFIGADCEIFLGILSSSIPALNAIHTRFCTKNRLRRLGPNSQEQIISFAIPPSPNAGSGCAKNNSGQGRNVPYGLGRLAGDSVL